MINHFDITRTQHNDAWWFLVSPMIGHEDSIAVLTAESIVHKLLHHMPVDLGAWFARRNGGPPHSLIRKASLEAFLMVDFKDEHNETQLQGAIAEHLWASLAGDIEGGWGRPLHIEHQHFSVNDHGGDGLSIYEFEALNLRFRLWESKRHDATTSVTNVVTKAAGQINDNGTRYLARMTKALQTHGDPRIEILSGRIVDLWSERDHASGVGVSVGTTTPIEDLPIRPFQGLCKAFAIYTSPDNREGLIIQISNLQALALLVRAELLKGIN